MEYDYKTDLLINENDLINEWLTQPALYMKYAEAASESSSDKLEAKRALEIEYANIDSDVRKNPKKYGIDGKLTEKQIESIIILNQVYQDKQKELIDYAKRAEILNQARVAFEHRKKSLEYISQLTMSGFYGEPNPKKINDKIRERLNQSLKIENEDETTE